MTLRAVLREVLRDHYLLSINRDPQVQANPVCACTEFLGWHPSDRPAVDAWAEHVLARLSQRIKETP